MLDKEIAKLSAIQIILAKMEGYRQAWCDQGFNFGFDDEMRVLREFCDSQKQFINVLEYYDDGRYEWSYKHKCVIDTENHYESDSDEELKQRYAQIARDLIAQEIDALEAED